MFKAPTQTPSISTLLDDLPTTDLKRVARHLGLSVDTIRRYAKTNNAPRLVHLALFWETRWGLSVLDCELFNRETLRLGMIRCLKEENAQLKAHLARLVALGAHGAANDALWSVVHPGAVIDLGNRNRDGLINDLRQNAVIPKPVTPCARLVPSEALAF